MLLDWTRAMPQGWIKSLPMIALLLSAAVTLSSCNTISGTVGGVGKDIAMIGNTLSGVSGDCRRGNCSKPRHDCGPRGCRQTRRVSSECVGAGCGRGGRGYRAPRYERVSYRERYAYRDRYNHRRDPYCCR